MKGITQAYFLLKIGELRRINVSVNLSSKNANNNDLKNCYIFSLIHINGLHFNSSKWRIMN